MRRAAATRRVATIQVALAGALCGLGTDGRHQARLERSGRLHLRHRARERGRDRPQLLHVRPAALAAGQVTLQQLGLELRQRADHIGPDVLLVFLVAARVHATASPSPSRILSSASRILPLTVPSGMPSISAICEWVKPPKYASSTTFN